MKLQIRRIVWRVALVAFVYAFGWPAEYKDKPLPAYESTPKQCYVLLQPLGNSVFSSKAPVCMAVLENLNRFCGEPPQFERRKIHASSHISEPAWIPIDPLENFEIVKQTISGTFPPQYREEKWRLQEARLRTLAQEGVLQLAKADLRGVAADLREGVQTVYRLENAGDSGLVGHNQPRVMFVPGDRTPPEVLSSFHDHAVGDVWIFNDHLLLVRYLQWPQPVHRVFVVSELTRPRLGPSAPIGATERCTLQFKNDRTEGK
jgi:hypothetical protein